MSPNPSQDAGGTPQPSQQPQGSNDYDDRQMIRHLVSKYTPADLARLFQEEGRTSRFPADDQASIVSYASSTLSEEPPSLFDSASIRSFSDTSSITGSIFSNVSSKLLGRKGGSSSAQAAAVAQAQVQAAHAEAAASWPDQDMPLAESGAGPETPTSASISTSLAKQKTSYPCGFCREEGIVKTCTRKNDLKRHIEDFHNADAQWFCRHRGCQMVFDWQTAYKTHLKHMHGGSRMSLDEAKVNLCPQLVFACGFENCPLVFEASDDDDSAQTFKEYVSHVVKHFDEGGQTTEWSYSTRIRNLLGQSRVAESWAECGLNGSAKSQLQWHPQTSGVLRKRLECRHIGEVKLLIHYAIALGSEPMRMVKFREDFVTPFKDSCKELGPGHNGRKQLVAQEPSDPFQFRISRGANPALAAYLHSQRRVYVPNTRNRTPRPHHQQRSMLSSPPTSNPMTGGHMNGSTHYFVPLPETQPSSPLYESPPQHFTPAGNMMHHQAGGIVDDLRDMRSIASCSPEPDISMTDTPLMPDYSSAYTPGIQSPCGTDNLGSPVALDHQSPFYHGDPRQHAQPHAF